MKRKVIFFILLVFIVMIFHSYQVTAGANVSKNINKLDLSKTNKLMIVAHPDDELLWGGAHLIDDDYLVVCVTCGVNKKRVKEFVSVMNVTNDKYLMLGYPDKRKNERDNWNGVYSDIQKDLNKIIKYKNWDLIVTHNPQGEYGHIHHKMTSTIVTNIANHDKLQYFGIYYSKLRLESENPKLDSISDEKLYEKEKISLLYTSQKNVINNLGHMMKYENWISYNDWNSIGK